jgi:hypothetical protein
MNASVPHHCVVRVFAQLPHCLHHLVGRPSAADSAEGLLDVDVELKGTGTGTVGGEGGERERVKKE